MNFSIFLCSTQSTESIQKFSPFLNLHIFFYTYLDINSILYIKEKRTSHCAASGPGTRPVGRHTHGRPTRALRAPLSYSRRRWQRAPAVSFVFKLRPAESMARPGQQRYLRPSRLAGRVLRSTAHLWTPLALAFPQPSPPWPDARRTATSAGQTSAATSE